MCRGFSLQSPCCRRGRCSDGAFSRENRAGVHRSGLPRWHGPCHRASTVPRPGIGPLRARAEVIILSFTSILLYLFIDLFFACFIFIVITLYYILYYYYDYIYYIDILIVMSILGVPRCSCSVYGSASPSGPHFSHFQNLVSDIIQIFRCVCRHSRHMLRNDTVYGLEHAAAVFSSLN